MLQEAIGAKPHVGLTVARDAEPLELRTLDPRAYAIASHVLSSEPDDVWSGRTRCASDLLSRMNLTFEPEQEDVLPELTTGDSIDSPRI